MRESLPPYPGNSAAACFNQMIANCFYCQGEAKTAPFVDGDGIGHAAVCNRGSCAEHAEMAERKQRETRGLHDLRALQGASMVETVTERFTMYPRRDFDALTDDALLALFIDEELNDMLDGRPALAASSLQLRKGGGIRVAVAAVNAMRRKLGVLP